MTITKIPNPSKVQCVVRNTASLANKAIINVKNIPKIDSSTVKTADKKNTMSIRIFYNTVKELYFVVLLDSVIQVCMQHIVKDTMTTRIHLRRRGSVSMCISPRTDPTL